MTEWSWNILLLSSDNIIDLDRFNKKNTLDYEHIDFALSVPTVDPVLEWGTRFNANFDDYPDGYSFVTYPNGYNKKNSLHFRKCEVIGNGDLFIRLKELVNHYQTEYNKQLKDNKI